MTIVSVPLYRNLLKSAKIDKDATVGAQIGVNLLLPDGSVGTVAQLRKLFGATAAPSTSLNTTDDLEEGQFNFYFTIPRFYAALKDALLPGLNITITPDDDAETITIAALSGNPENYAINGAFDVWRRGTSFNSATSAQNADCWACFAIGSTIATTREFADSSLPDAARFFCRDVVTAGVATGDIAQRILRIEDIFQFSGKDVYYALLARTSINCDIAVDLVQMYGDHMGSPQYGVGPIGRTVATMLADQWQVVSAGPVSLPLAYPPSFPDPGTSGLQLSLWMNAGADWVAGGGPAVGLNSGTYDWALVSISDTPIKFRRTMLDEEIRRCHRYLEMSFPTGTAPAQNAGISGAYIAPQVVAASTASAIGHVFYKSTKVRNPTVTLFNPSAANAQPRNVTGSTDWSSAAITADSSDGFSVTGTSAAGSSAGQTAAFHWSAEAYLNPSWNGVSPPTYGTLTITGSFAAGTVGTAYSSSLPITGGLEPYTLTGGTGIVSGSLDAGFALSITGSPGARFLTLACASPSAADTMTFTASVDSSDSQTATSPQSVVVSTAAASTTWNPATSDPSMIIVGNLISAGGFAAGVGGSALATNTRSTGKHVYYVDNTSSNTAYLFIALGTATYSEAVSPLDFANTVAVCQLCPGNIYDTSGAYTNLLPNTTNLTAGALGVDFDAGKIWVGRAVSGTFAWVGSPSTGTGNSFSFTPNTPLLPVGWVGYYGGATTLTGEFASSSIDPAALPSGWIGWDS